MGTLHLIAQGLLGILEPHTILVLLIGLVIGMAVSIMPGLGLVMGVVLARPFTYSMALKESILLLTAI